MAVIHQSSNTSLKAEVLHNANKNPYTPVAHAVGMNEKYKSISFILKAVNYDAQLWYICDNLKVTGLPLKLAR